MKTFTANLASKRKQKPLGEVLRQDTPHAVVLTEAYRAHRWLRRLAKRRGYTMLARDRKHHGSEAPDIVMLVRSDVLIHDTAWLVMGKTWTGPLAGKAHEPRQYPLAVLELPGDTTPWALLGMHAPTANNHDAQAETFKRLVVCAYRKALIRFVVAGDFNQKANQLADVAKRAKCEVIEGTLVDHCLINGNVQHFATMRRVLQPAGCHGWNLYKLNGKEPVR